MNLSLRLACVFLGSLLPALPLVAQTAAPATAPAAPAAVTPSSELNDLRARIMTKVRAGQKSATELAAEIAEFDSLLAKYAGNKSDEVAQILFMKGAFFAQVLDDQAAAIALLKDLIAGYPGTKAAANGERLIGQMERAAKAAATQAGLAGKPAPELNFTWRSNEGPKTLSELRGKVVVLDFWATWCGPCIASFPNVRALVDHYRGSDVVVIGVTSLQGFVAGLEGGRVDTKGNPEKEMALMPEFMKAKQMNWTVAFSKEEVFNPDYGISGIPYVAIIAPDGTVRHAGLHPAGPLTDKVAKIDAILKEFGRSVPAAPATSS
jgi:thiol-disulfide isomerase/thioredoxin